MLKNLACALILTEAPAPADKQRKPPKVAGRIVTTLAKAKEVRPLVEKCVTLACKAWDHVDAARPLKTDAPRHSDAWKAWREGPQWRAWAAAIAPAVAIRRRLQRLLGQKKAVTVLLAKVAPRFRNRPGGYTRIVRLPRPRVGDAGPRAILEFTGVRDRKVERAVRPAFAEGDGAAPTGS
jgi:large subunit ribosomal protein L17